MAARRLLKEYKQLVEDAPEGIHAGPTHEDDFLHWECLLDGPEGSLYEGGCFKAVLDFPKEYPMKPPTMRFVSEIFHPNIGKDGKVCISILHSGDDPSNYEQRSERWSAAQSVEKILLSVMSMLAEPNPDSPANVDASKMMREDMATFKQRAADNLMEGFSFDIDKIRSGHVSELDKLFSSASQNASCFRTPEERNAVMNALISGVSQAKERDGVKFLECLRVLLRDVENARCVYSRPSIEAVASASHLSDNLLRSVDGVKAVVNFALRGVEIEKSGPDATQVLAVLREMHWGPLALNWLLQETALSLDSDAVFALCRLLNALMWEKQIAAEVGRLALIDVLLQLLEHVVAALEKKTPAPDEATQARRFNIAGDVMRIFFQLTMEYGPLASKSKTAYPITSEAKAQEEERLKESPMPEHVVYLFSRSIELLKRTLLLDFRNPQEAQLQLACVTFAINLPKAQILQFDAHKVLPHLMDILHHHLEVGDNSATASVLMLFTKIARDEPRTRAIFMMRLFPRWKEVFDSNDGEGVRMPKQHEGTTGKLIIDGMQSSNTGLQFYANEFVFLLCNENAGAFTKFVGFGPAAGHLAVRGLMNMGNVKAQGGESVHQGAATAVEASRQDGERVTNWKEKKILDPDMSDMSPEDVKEWNELCDKMERLDSLGVIKMVKKPDEQK